MYFIINEEKEKKGMFSLYYQLMMSKKVSLPRGLVYQIWTVGGSRMGNFLAHLLLIYQWTDTLGSF